MDGLGVKGTLIISNDLQNKLLWLPWTPLEMRSTDVRVGHSSGRCHVLTQERPSSFR